MKNKEGIFALVFFAIVNVLVVWEFSAMKAVVSTMVGLFFSLPWYLVLNKVIEDKRNNEDVDSKLSTLEYCYLVGPGIGYYLILWAILIVVQMHA